MIAKAKILKDIGNTLSKNSPSILTGIGVAGLISTTVLAVKATPKALQLMGDKVWEKYEEENPNVQFHEWVGTDDAYDVIPLFRILTPKEVIKTTWKCYMPAAIVGSITIACIIGANSINLRRNAALATVYSLSEAAFKEYKAKVVETIGKKQEQKIRDEIAKDRINKNPVNNREIILTGKGEMLCYDSLSGRYFKSNIEEIRKVINDIGRKMLNDMFVTLNEVYYELGLKGTKMGDLVGFHIDDGVLEPCFSSQLADDGTPCLVLDFYTEPRYIYTD